MPSPPALCVHDPAPPPSSTGAQTRPGPAFYPRTPTSAPSPPASVHPPPLNHQPSAAHSSRRGLGALLVKSNPIIRHSAVWEKKKTFLWYILDPPPSSAGPFFSAPLEARRRPGPLCQLALSLCTIDLFFLSFFLSVFPSCCACVSLCVSLSVFLSFFRSFSFLSCV